MSKRRKWYEPYCRTFRERDASGAWLEVDKALCPINDVPRQVALRAGGLPATRDLPAVYDGLMRQVRPKVVRWWLRTTG